MVDNSDTLNDNEIEIPDIAKAKVFKDVIARFNKVIASMKEAGASEEEIVSEINVENSDAHEKAVKAFTITYNMLVSPKTNKCDAVEKIKRDKAMTDILSDDYVNRFSNKYLETAKGSMDYDNVVYRETNHRRRDMRGFTGFHSWRELEQYRAGHGGGIRQGNSVNEKHSEMKCPYNKRDKAMTDTPSDDYVNRFSDEYLKTAKGSMDYGNVVYRETVYRRRYDAGFTGFHFWGELEQYRAGHGG